MIRLAKTLGIITQGIVLGSLLFLALIRLMAVSEGARVFQYQGF